MKSNSKSTYNTVDGIKLLSGIDEQSQKDLELKIEGLKKLIEPYERKQGPLLTPLEPSTLTIGGLIENLVFTEKELIEALPVPPSSSPILLIGCNSGEKFNPRYKPPTLKVSNKGRKKKVRIKKTRRSGAYFASQITFVIEHGEGNLPYKIKLFNNGTFQVPGIKDPEMKTLVGPIKILCEYLKTSLNKPNICVKYFTAVMRNYKARLINENYSVDLEKLEQILYHEKNNPIYRNFLNTHVLNSLTDQSLISMFNISSANYYRIAELSYNTDKCFCLIVKFRRPTDDKPDKKTTIKMMKKSGKLNFDGGNSEAEIIELYYFINYIYHLYKDKILFDISNIKNAESDNTSVCDDESIYSDDLNEEKKKTKDSGSKINIDDE
jgi:hypothetical protein